MNRDELYEQHLKARIKCLEKQIGANLPERFSPMELKFLFTCLSEASDSLSHAKYNSEECEAIQRMINKVLSLPEYDDDIDVCFEEVGRAPKDL
jgi:hypothetical protein